MNAGLSQTGLFCSASSGKVVRHPVMREPVSDLSQPVSGPFYRLYAISGMMVATRVAVNTCKHA